MIGWVTANGGLLDCVSLRRSDDSLGVGLGKERSFNEVVHTYLVSRAVLRV